MTSVPIGIAKYEGAGNDFLIMIDLESRVRITPQEVVNLCDRAHGVGADGFITISGPSGGGEVTMTLVNADGSSAEISGNGLRCVGHAVVRSGVVAGGTFSVMTGAGLRRVTCGDGSAERVAVEATMGQPVVESADSELRECRVSVGNPHLVRVVDDLSGIDVARLGAELQSLLPGGINVEFIEIIDFATIRLGVYERGVGPTQACGSGSVAAVKAAQILGLTDARVDVINPGGTLGVRIDENDEAWLSGDTHHIADLVVTLERSS